MRVLRFASFASVLAAVLCPASAASAQATSHSDVPDTFRIEAGGFRIGADTNLSFNSLLSRELGGTLRYSGGQIVLAGAF